MVTDQQVRRLRRFDLQGLPQGQAAAKAGIDDKTARKYRRLGKLPSEVRPMDRPYRTRTDPFALVWPQLEAQLTLNPGLQAKTLFGWLQRQYPGRFPDGQLRTLQRHVKRWRALHGAAKEVFFAQVHQPGRLGASDFTHCTDLNITLGGVLFPHLVYHFVLTYSNWETGTVCFAESFESLSEGLQNALWELGGVPAVHRTDCLTAAVPPGGDRQVFQQRYQALLRHYDLRGQAINPGEAHENGDAEQSHHQFKRALEQALLLRGSRDFANQGEYEAFLRQLFSQCNAGRQQRLAEEVAVLRPLPGRRLEACQRLRVRVDRGSTIHVRKNVYSVPSRLIGEWVEARLDAGHVEVWYGQRLVERLERGGAAQHRVNYRRTWWSGWGSERSGQGVEVPAARPTRGPRRCWCAPGLLQRTFGRRQALRTGRRAGASTPWFGRRPPAAQPLRVNATPGAVPGVLRPTWTRGATSGGGFSTLQVPRTLSTSALR